MPRPRYLAIEGPIGVGKTSLTDRLAQEFGYRTVYEEFEENPFLANFYGDRQAYAFQTQLFFLLARYRQQDHMYQQDLFQQGIVADYLFAKDPIFAHLNLDPNEVQLYDQIYRALDARVLRPDLVIYLQASVETLLGRIRNRGREYERNMDPQYLADLSESYNRYFFRYNDAPLLVVNSNELNLIDDDDAYRDLIKKILSHRGGVHHFVRQV